MPTIPPSVSSTVSAKSGSVTNPIKYNSSSGSIGYAFISNKPEYHSPLDNIGIVDKGAPVLDKLIRYKS